MLEREQSISASVDVWREVIECNLTPDLVVAVTVVVIAVDNNLGENLI